MRRPARERPGQRQVEIDAERRAPLAATTTTTRGLRLGKQRLRIVPVVHPDMCGVITMFGSVWKGSVEGCGLGVDAEG